MQIGSDVLKILTVTVKRSGQHFWPTLYVGFISKTAQYLNLWTTNFFRWQAPSRDYLSPIWAPKTEVLETTVMRYVA